MPTKKNKNVDLPTLSDTVLDDQNLVTIDEQPETVSPTKKRKTTTKKTVTRKAKIPKKSENIETVNEFLSSPSIGGANSFFQPNQSPTPPIAQPIINDEQVKVGVKDLNNQNISRFYKKFIIFIIVIAIVLAGFIVHYSLAKAVISVTPKYNEHAISFTAQIVTPDYPKLNEQPDLLIGRKLTTTVSQKKSFAATAGEGQKSSKTSGEVTIYNKSNKNQTLIATTRLQTADNKLFRLVNNVEVPAGGEIKTIAQADQEGDDYLIPATRFIIPGLWEGVRDKIYAESQAPMSYQSTNNKVVTQENIDQAVSELTKELSQQAIEKFNQEKTVNEKVNPDALIVNELKKELSAKVGDQVDSFDLTLELEIIVITYDEQKLLSKIQNDIDIVSQQNNGLVKHSSNDITLSIKELSGDDKQIIGVITGKYKIQLANPDIDTNQLKGKKINEAQTYLNSLQSIEKFDIKLLPFWLQKIPKLDNHIQIILNK